jgi:excisionase family DNA binding protein
MAKTKGATRNLAPAILPEFLRVNPGCDYIGVKRTKMYDLIKQGRVKLYKLDGVSLLRRSELDALARAR